MTCEIRAVQSRKCNDRHVADRTIQSLIHTLINYIKVYVVHNVSKT